MILKSIIWTITKLQITFSQGKNECIYIYMRVHNGTDYSRWQYMACSVYLSISHWEMLIVCSPTYLLALVMSCNGFSTPSVRCQARDPAPVFTRFYHPICWAKHQNNSCYCHSGNQEKNRRASDTFVKLFFVFMGITPTIITNFLN